MGHSEPHHHADSHGHDGKPHGFLNTVFEESMGGFGILWVSILLVSIFLVMFLG